MTGRTACWKCCLAQGESAIKYKPPLSVRKDTYDYSFCLARSVEYNHLMTDSPGAGVARGEHAEDGGARADREEHGRDHADLAAHLARPQTHNFVLKRPSRPQKPAAAEAPAVETLKAGPD